MVIELLFQSSSWGESQETVSGGTGWVLRGGRADDRGCRAPEPATEPAHCTSPARLGMSEGCASRRSSLDQYKSMFAGGGGGRECGGLCFSLLPQLASGSSQHRLSCTSRVLGISEKFTIPNVFVGLTGSLGCWWPAQHGACCCWRDPVSAPQPQSSPVLPALPAYLGRF